MQIDIKPKQTYQYIEVLEGDTYVWFSNKNYHGYTLVTIDSFDEECNLALMGQFADKKGNIKIKFFVSDMVELETSS